MTLKEQITAAVDGILNAARENLEDSRPVAVQNTAAGPVRAATAKIAYDQGHGHNTAGELHIAHLLMAELAVRVTAGEIPR